MSVTRKMPNPQKAATEKRGSTAVMTIPRAKSIKLIKRRMDIERFFLLRTCRAVMEFPSALES